MGDEIYLLKKAQTAYLKADETPTKVLSKYADFTNILLPKLAAELPEHTRINGYGIELVDDWQPPYGSIYSLGSIELETLKAHIKNNLANGFIKPFQSPTRALILFNKKPDNKLKLYVNYQGLENLTIKNQYPLPLVRKFLDRLDWV